MNMRKFSSLTAFVSFILLVATSIVLYVEPQGRVAYWSDWRMMGLSKTDWGNIHLNIGLLFLLAMALHLFYNWKPLVSYFKARVTAIRGLSRELRAALALTILVAIGTWLMLPPFSWVIDFNEALKEQAAVRYGEPPYGHAELSSLKTFWARTGMEPAASRARLEQAGIEVENDTDTILAVARRNGLTPQGVYRAMLPSKAPKSGREFPASPPAGFGRHSLTEVCRDYGLVPSDVIRHLADAGLSATADMSIREIAKSNSAHPQDVFEVLKQFKVPGSK